MLQKKYKKTYPYLANAIIVIFFLIVCSLPFFNQLNFLILDQFQGGIKARKEIVLIKIDDQSLQKLGSWPWSRNIIAQGIDKISQAKAAVVGVDVVFFESRDGDTELQNSLNNSKVPIVLGNKILENQEYKTIFSANKVTQAYTNITPDPDGKVRQTNLVTQVQNQCLESLAFGILKQYFHDKNSPICPQISNQAINLGPNLRLDDQILFNYTDESFNSYSFDDLYAGKIDSRNLENKIVLIGVTATDIKSNVSDQFLGIKGRSISGVELNANIINSILQNKFQNPLDLRMFSVVILAISSLLFWLYSKIKNNWLELALFTSSTLAINIFGLFLFDYGLNWPVVNAAVILLATYIFYVAYKYLIESRQNLFLKQAFTQYINPKLLNKLLKSPDSLTLGGEKKNMTVMFSDIRGFTTVSERLDPQSLINIINHYLERMCGVVLKNDGTIDKFIGDAIMAFWNAPLEQDKHEFMAIKTAIEMEEALSKFNQDYGQNFKIGIGINSGDMIVGNVGSSIRFDYTVLGDNVNLGSRIEALTKKYALTTLVTESVVKHLLNDENSIIYRIIDQVIVKGKSQAIKIYQPMLNTESNQNLKVVYTKGFEAYQKGGFVLAKKIWEQISQDPTTKIMLSRLDQFEINKPLEWNGIWIWDEK